MLLNSGDAHRDGDEITPAITYSMQQSTKYNGCGYHMGGLEVVFRCHRVDVLCSSANDLQKAIMCTHIMCSSLFCCYLANTIDFHHRQLDRFQEGYDGIGVTVITDNCESMKICIFYDTRS